MIKSSLKKFYGSKSTLNAGASYLGFGSALIKGLLSIPIAVLYLDKQELGLWAVVSAFLGYLAWSDFGIGASVGRTIAPAIARREQREIDIWWSTTRIVLVALGVVVVILGIACTPILLKFMQLPEGLVKQAGLLWAGGVLLVGLGYPMRGVHGILVAQHRMYWSSLLQAVSCWVHLTCFYLFLQLDYGVYAYLWALAGTYIFTWTGYNICLRYGDNRPRFKWTKIEGWRLKKIFSLGGNMTVIGIVDSIIKTLPALLIARLGSLSMVPLYNFSWRGPELMNDGVLRTFQSFYPQLQRYYVSGELESFRKLYAKVGWLTLSVSLIFAGIVIALNQTIVSVLATEEYYIGAEVNVWFAVAIVLFSMSRYYRVLLLLSGSMGKHATVAIAKLLVALFLSPLSWKYFGVSGLAALFAMLPLFNGVYGYVKGVRSCGFNYQNLAPEVTIAVVTSIVLLLIMASVVGHFPQYGSDYTLIVFGRDLKIPTLSLLVIGGGVSTLGTALLRKAFQSPK